MKHLLPILILFLFAVILFVSDCGKEASREAGIGAEELLYKNNFSRLTGGETGLSDTLQDSLK